MSAETAALAALDHIDQGISIIDRQLRLIGWNRRFLELLDFPSDFGCVGRPFSDFIRYNAQRGEYGPGDPETQVTQRLELAKRFEPHCFERTRPNGTVLEIRGTPMAARGFVTLYTDITERKTIEAALAESRTRLEARVGKRTAELQALNQRLVRESLAREQIADELRQSERWMRLIMDAVPARIAYVDANRRYRFANKKHEELYGISAEAFIGRRAGDVVDRISSKAYESHIDAALSGKQTTFEYAFTSPNNRVVHIRSTYIPHFGVTGKVLGYFILGEDLTEYKRTERALHQMQKMEALGHLTGGIAHDFNNLLTVIMGELAFLEDEPGFGENAADAVRTAVSAARRGATLTGRLLAFSRRQALQPVAVDPQPLLAEIKQFLQRTLGGDIHTEIYADEDLWHLLADPNELTSALLNLAINARDAMPSGGRLTIGAANVVLEENASAGHSDAAPAGEYILLTVADNGVGMSAETLEHAFEPLFTTKAPGAGTGLGLSMVYGFARQSGGHVEIASQPHRGTTVNLFLPRASPPKDPNRSSGPADKSSHLPDATILLVEDDVDVRRFIARTLKKLGYGVLEAADARSALAVLAQVGVIDLLLTDIIMPGDLDGVDLIGEARRRYPDLRVLCVSGYAHEIGAKLAPWSASIVFLRKPFDTESLIEAVHTALEASDPPSDPSN